MDHITSCPKCGSQLQVKLIFASGPKSASTPSSDIGSLLEHINDDSLESGAAKFIAETRERFEKYGDNIRMSDKQMAWLRRLAEG